VWHDSFICVTWLIHVCDMTHSYVWHDSFICVTWLVHVCDMTRSYVWHHSFIRVTWLIHMCDMTHSYVWHDSFIRVTWHALFIFVTRLILILRGMEWLRLVGSLKSQVSFAKEPYKRDNILQKRPIILRSLLIEATPCDASASMCNLVWGGFDW